MSPENERTSRGANDPDRPAKATWAVHRPTGRLRALAAGSAGDLAAFAKGAARTVSRRGRRAPDAGQEERVERRGPDPVRRAGVGPVPHRSLHARMIDLRTGWARLLPARAAREAAQSLLVKPLLRSELAVEVYGAQAAVDLAPVLLVANHASHLDAAVIVAGLPDAVRRRTVVAASADYFFDAWWRALPSALVFNSLPVHDGDVSGAARLLARGWSVLVFGEPSRSDDGSVHDFDRTVGDLALRTSAPVLPVGIRGTFAAMPRGRFRIRSGRPRVSIRYGAPVRPRPGEAAPDVARRVTQAVRLLIAEDTATWWQVLRGRAESQAAPDPSAAAWRRVWAQTDRNSLGGPSRGDRIWH